MKYMKLGSKPDVFQTEENSIRLKLRQMDSTRHAMALMLCLLAFLLPGTAAAISTGFRHHGNMGWGYIQPRPKTHYFCLSYKSPHQVSRPGMQWPTILWLQGGPGGSGVGRGNYQEIGPKDVDFKRRQWTWLKVAHLIFVDAPVGAGYSFVENASALVTTDEEAVADLYAVLKSLIAHNISTLQPSCPLYIVGESYGGKLAAILGLELRRSILAGTLNLTLGGVVLGDAWISPGDSALSYASLLHSVSRLDDNAAIAVQRMGEKVEALILAGKFTKARQAFTDQLNLIDSQSNGVSMYNFMLDAGMSGPVLTTYNTEINSTLVHNTIDSDMNGPMRKMFMIIPKNITWQEASIDTYNALKGSFMKPAIEQVGLLLTLGVKVTIYQGQCDVIASTVGAEAWVRKLKWFGLKEFLSVPRVPLHLCDMVKSCSKEIKAYVRSYKNLEFYWILGAGHMVPVDQPYTAFRMIANATQSPGGIV